MSNAIITMHCILFNEDCTISIKLIYSQKGFGLTSPNTFKITLCACYTLQNSFSNFQE